MGKVTEWRNDLFYFGCIDRPGHRLTAPGEGSVYGLRAHDFLEGLDGKLAPVGQQDQFRAKLWRLTGYTPTPYSALSWWDRSVDKREGSNSTLFAPGHTVTAEGILELGQRLFPRIMSRLPAIEILPGEHHNMRAALTERAEP